MVSGKLVADEYLREMPDKACAGVSRGEEKTWM